MGNNSYGFGQLTEPIIIDNAMRGQVVNEDLLLVNNKNKPIIVKLKPVGDIEPWVTFFKTTDDLEPITEIKVSTSSNLNILARITVPNDLSNGEYSGSINVILDPENGTNSTSTYAKIAQVVEREVKINIIDKEEVELEVFVIPNKYDFASGEDLELKISFLNKGNIEVRPSVEIKILKNEEIFYNRIYPYLDKDDPISPLSKKEISIKEISFKSLDFDKYNVLISILNNDKEIENKWINVTYREVEDGEVGLVASTDEDYNVLAVVLTGIGILSIFVIILLVFDRKYMTKNN